MIRDAIKWPYYNPFFGEAKIEADGWKGVAESGVNLLLWSALVGGAAHLLGAKRPVLIGGLTLAGLVAAEVIFGAAGRHSSEHHFQIAPVGENGAPATAATIIDNPNFSEADNGGFGETDNSGFGNA